MQDQIAPFLAFAAALLAAMRLGGGAYETLLIDPKWPTNIALVQPARGGIDRKRFWIPAHIVFELVMIAALWASWSHVEARLWLIIGLASHLVMRAWSLAYFVPLALRFERAGDLTPDMVAQARTWARSSALRLPLAVLTLLSVSLAAIRLLGA